MKKKKKEKEKGKEKPEIRHKREICSRPSNPSIQVIPYPNTKGSKIHSIAHRTANPPPSTSQDIKKKSTPNQGRWYIQQSNVSPQLPFSGGTHSIECPTCLGTKGIR